MVQNKVFILKFIVLLNIILDRDGDDSYSSSLRSEPFASGKMNRAQEFVDSGQDGMERNSFDTQKLILCRYA